EDGLYEYHETSGTLRKIGNTTIKSLHQWDDHTVLAGGFNEAYFIRNDEDWQQVVFLDDAEKELQASILHVRKDGLGGVWMGTAGRGVFYYHPHQRKFTPSRITVNNAPKKDFISIFHFLRDGDDLWMATDLGFVKHNLRTDRYKLYRTDLLEYALAKDVHHTIWAGGF